MYAFRLKINGRELRRIVIDPHYEEKHSSSVDDKIIIELVKKLNGETYQAKSVDEDGFQYFVSDHLKLETRFYKLIWLLHPKEPYLGVVNAYRRRT